MLIGLKVDKLKSMPEAEFQGEVELFDYFTNLDKSTLEGESALLYFLSYRQKRVGF